MTSLNVIGLFLCLLATAIAVTAHNRHLLHQPFFPVSNTITSPPSQSPSGSPKSKTESLPQPQIQQPKFPFSFNVPNSPRGTFFPTSSSPPTLSPPPPTVLATFPANISSIVFPHSSSSSGHVHKRLFVWLSISLSLLFSAILAGISAYLLYSRHRRTDTKIDTETTAPKKASKSSERVRLFPPNTLPSDSPPHNDKLPIIPPRSGVPSTSSSEFLYLGTLANPNTPEYQQRLSTLTNNVGIKGSISSSLTSTSASRPQNIGSPDLNPLPPLPKTTFEAMYTSGEMLVDAMKKQQAALDYEMNECQKFSASRGENNHFGTPCAGNVAVRSDKSCPGSLFCDDGGILNENFPSSFPSSYNNSLFNSPSHVSNQSSVGAAYPQEKSTKVVTVEKGPSSASTASSSSSSLSLPPSPRERGTGISWSPENSSPEVISSHIESQRSAPSFGEHRPVPPDAIPELPSQAPAQRLLGNLTEDDLCFERAWCHPDKVESSEQVLVHSGGLVARKEQLCLKVDGDDNAETLKPKLKPLHWDKVRASSDRAMVWDQIKSNSFQLNEEMIETLFIVNNAKLTQKDNVKRTNSGSAGENHVLDPRKSQNIAILLRALNVTIDEVREALLEGSCDTLGTELLESLKKMAPTLEEECKLREIKDDSSNKLGSAEKFLKTLVDIPFAFKRIDALIYIANFDSEIEYLRKSFSTLEAASAELRNSRMFQKLLEAVLKTGNRMNIGTNRGDAQAFRLDTLLKLVDIKGADGKTTLLHFVVQEIIRSEGLRICEDPMEEAADTSQQSGSGWHDDVRLRKLGLQVVSGLSGELGNVKKAAAMDSEVLRSEVSSLSGGMGKVREVLKLSEEMATEGSGRFSESMMRFLNKAAEDIIKIQAQEAAAATLVKQITEYFHGDRANEEAQPLRIFMVVRDFVVILDRVCKDVGKINERTIYGTTRPVEFSLNSISL